MKIPHLKPDIILYGEITDEKVKDFFGQMNAAREKEGPLVFELTTLGGNADAGRRIALDLKMFQDLEDREIYFLGKTAVYSIGVVIMSAFPQERRFLARSTRLMVHERRITKDVQFDGALSACIQSAEELLSQFKTGYDVAREDFDDLARGSAITSEEILKRAKHNWYLTAEEALELKLIAGIV